eukprot:1559245-Amphidinium_carterae.1
MSIETGLAAWCKALKSTSHQRGEGVVAFSARCACKRGGENRMTKSRKEILSQVEPHRDQSLHFAFAASRKKLESIVVCHCLCLRTQSVTTLFHGALLGVSHHCLVDTLSLCCLWYNMRHPRLNLYENFGFRVKFWKKTASKCDMRK